MGFSSYSYVFGGVMGSAKGAVWAPAFAFDFGLIDEPTRELQSQLQSSRRNRNEVILICTDSIPPESQWFDVLIISTEISHVGLTVPLISCIMVTFESISHKPSIAPQALAAGQMIWNWFASWKSRSFVYMGGNLQEPRLISHETMVKPFLSPYNKSVGFRINP